MPDLTGDLPDAPAFTEQVLGFRVLCRLGGCHRPGGLVRVVPSFLRLARLGAGHASSAEKPQRRSRIERSRHGRDS